MVQITLDSTHAYPLAVAVFSGFVVQYLGAKVSGARKRANVPYPYMYATREEAEKEPTKHLFNCAQRAHQNTLENYPQFLML
ncbi:hypothetical protein BC833DRAFT_606730 [Globomyces pollinis-pini]|nr:hypothetical protein BC833DRAFT_606730 [Globomyces pollinis-pini]